MVSIAAFEILLGLALVLALQVLGPETPKVAVRLRDGGGHPRSALLLLVPAGAEAGDLDAVQRAVAGLSSLRGPSGALAPRPCS